MVIFDTTFDDKIGRRQSSFFIVLSLFIKFLIEYFLIMLLNNENRTTHNFLKQVEVLYRMHRVLKYDFIYE